jgi:flavin reductase (DIM6/NTAB) family NADH-FMN oxidoreductase RutF
MELSSQENPNAVYKLMLGSVVPRPIAWVSTLSEDGVPNLAPFSFFNLVCSRPPTLLFSTGVRGTDGKQKDTGLNAIATGEFVVNLVTEALAEAMNRTATELPAEIDEYEYAGLAAAASRTVKPPRVAASPVAMECRVSQVVQIGDGQPGSGYVVFGEVQHIYVADGVLADNYRINLETYKPIGRMSGPHYSRTNEMFEMFREPSRIEPSQP